MIFFFFWKTKLRTLGRLISLKRKCPALKYFTGRISERNLIKLLTHRVYFEPLRACTSPVLQSKWHSVRHRFKASLVSTLFFSFLVCNTGGRTRHICSIQRFDMRLALVCGATVTPEAPSRAGKTAELWMDPRYPRALFGGCPPSSANRTCRLSTLPRLLGRVTRTLKLARISVRTMGLRIHRVRTVLIVGIHEGSVSDCLIYEVTKSSNFQKLERQFLTFKPRFLR